MSAIENRRSIRRFADKDVSNLLIEHIMNAGTLAPSAKNRQPWYFVVSRRNQARARWIESFEMAVRKALEASPERNDLRMALESVEIMEQAPVVIFVCYRCGLCENHNDGVNWPLCATEAEVVDILSIGAAIENMLLKIQELGLGGLWCGDVLYAYRELMHELGTEYPMVSAVCVGYPAEDPKNRTRIPINQCSTDL